VTFYDLDVGDCFTWEGAGKRLMTIFQKPDTRYVKTGIVSYREDAPNSPEYTLGALGDEVERLGSRPTHTLDGGVDA